MNAKDNAEPVRVEKAFPAIITRAQFGRVGKLMRARAPKTSHPRRVGSTYLLSGLVKCKACNRALSGRDAKSGQFAYYVCQSIMKRAKNACVTPRLNARRFEQMIVDKIRSNILTEGSITELVKAVDEEMDGIASEQRKRLETIDTELEEVKRRLGRIWNAIETSDIDISDASDRIKEHRERKERLEDAATDARAILSERRAYLDDVNTIAAYAKDMKDFLNESELTERRAFIESFVKEIIVIPGDALIRYTIPISQSTTKTSVLMGGGLGSLRVRWIGLRPFSLDECFSSCAPSSSLNERLWPSGNSDETIRYSWTVGLAAADGGHTGTSNWSSSKTVSTEDVRFSIVGRTGQESTEAASLVTPSDGVGTGYVGVASSPHHLYALHEVADEGLMLRGTALTERRQTRAPRATALRSR